MKILGVIKIVIGVLLILTGVGQLLGALGSDSSDIYYMLGYILATLFFIVLGGWLIKSGRSNLSK